MRNISMIAAVAQNGVIGNNGTLPWHLKNDLKWFSEKTKNKVVVMGRKNYQDIIRFTKGKPLKDRINIVMTKDRNFSHEGFHVCHSLDEVFKFTNDDLMIIGGTEIYSLFLPFCNELILTEILHYFEGNSYFPKWSKIDFCEIFREEHIENNIIYDFVIYKKLKDIKT
jgi:dihydrofolate reductase